MGPRHTGNLAHLMAVKIKMTLVGNIARAISRMLQIQISDNWSIWSKRW